MAGTGLRGIADSFRSVFTFSQAGEVDLHDAPALRGEAMDRLVHLAVFGPSEDQETARWLIHELARRVGLIPFCPPARL